MACKQFNKGVTRHQQIVMERMTANHERHLHYHKQNNQVPTRSIG